MFRSQLHPAPNRDRDIPRAVVDRIKACTTSVFFETIEVRVLNQIPSTNTPKSACEEFVTRVLRGEKFTPEKINDLIVEHRKAIGYPPVLWL